MVRPLSILCFLRTYDIAKQDIHILLIQTTSKLWKKQLKIFSLENNSKKKFVM